MERPRAIAFVGAGAFPVTAALLAERYPDAVITCVDHDLRAYWLGREVLARHLPGVRYLYADGAELDYRSEDAVVVAAMVRAKARVVERALAQCEGPVVVKGDVAVEHARLTVIPADFDGEGRLRVADPPSRVP